MKILAGLFCSSSSYWVTNNQIDIEVMADCKEKLENKTELKRDR